MHRHTEAGTRPRRRRAGRTAAALSLLASVACSSAQHSPASVTAAGKSAEISVATWNMCGVEQWNCEDTGSPKNKFQQIRDLVGDSDVRVLLLQEVCSEELVAAALRLGPEWHSVFQPYAEVDAAGTSRRVECTGQGHGQAGYGLLAASPITDVEAVPTEQPTVGLHRGIVCARVPALRLRVCNAHIALRESDEAHLDWDFRDDQLSSLFEAAATDPRTVLGGDFNSPPPVGDRNTSAWIWPTEAYTTFRECDQKGGARTGRPTHTDGTKLDYLFTTLPRTACKVVDAKSSDHRALVMRVSRPTDTDGVRTSE
ncbi:endonuclease/exonuclease/phosphatase family protein [Streptomyces sp. NBC_00190]|uniref:endonuclease/exonuclease/phosphatase family protein n=1 Tax=unclassified Streptomyces TaxID=2593676 RepID=UPI002E28E98C|nr:endonuclease/exonuclease/phosphatase family protein [Streptomyces sp. NBC_00190]WSZ38763.1 endonuclease/exonuclease/phosphatase family protein [Streptomyces sp. NBC_00868]